MRVAKEVAKEDKAKKEKEEKKTVKRPRPGGYQNFQFQTPMQMPMQMAAGPSGYQNQQFQGSQLPQRIPKALLRCLNCGELGHFVRECTKQINTQK